MRYGGWNFEKTLLVRETANIARRGELLDVRLAVESDRAGNLANDVRVILKPDWHLLGREIPSQVYNIERHGETTTFRVACTIDLAAGQTQRIGVYYDNPNAAPPKYESALQVSGAGLARRIETPFYTIETDPRNGQVGAFTGKTDDQGATVLHRIDLPGAAQPTVAVVFATGGGTRPTAVSAADWNQPQIVDEAVGPICFKQTRRARLIPPGAPANDSWPELEITHKFFAEQPVFLAHSRLTFPADTGVFAICNDFVSLNAGQFSHYTFRPVSPTKSLPLTDVEEMGHVVIDPAQTAGLPPGLVFADFLPHDLAWHAFINTTVLKERAFAGIQLASSSTSPDGRSVSYRPGAYVLRDGKAIQWLRAPIYVQARTRRENVIRVPAGTVFEETNAYYFSLFDSAWGQQVDALGKRLNNPLDVTTHPIFLGQAPPERFELLPAGRRGDAYLRAGVR